MSNLLKLAPSIATEEVAVGGETITLRGLSADAIAYLASRFPEIFGTLKTAAAQQSVEWSGLVQLLGAAIGPVIAAGCGDLGDREAEAIASTLPFATQARLAVPILKRTFPDGVGPFVQWATAELAALAASAPAAPTQASGPVKIRSMKSRPPSGS